MTNVKFLPYVTNDIPSTTEYDPLDFCPDVQIVAYHPTKDSDPFSEFSQNAVVERLKIRIWFYAGDYQTAIDAVDIPGSLSNNFLSATVCVTDSIPTGLPACSLSIAPAFENDAGDYIFTHEFRVPTSWAGTQKYVNFIFAFQHRGQTDYIIVPVHVVTAARNFEASSGDAIFIDGIWKQGGQVVDKICTDIDQNVILEVTHERPTWKPIVILERGDTVIAEFDPFVAPAGFVDLEQLQEAPIVSVTSTPAITTQTETIELDEAQLTGDECVYVIVKKDIPSAPSECDDLEMELTFLIRQDDYFEISWNITGMTPLSTWNGSVQVNWFFDVNTSYTHTFNLTGLSGTMSAGVFVVESCPVLMNITASIWMLNGCTYNETKEVTQPCQQEITYNFF